MDFFLKRKRTKKENNNHNVSKKKRKRKKKKKTEGDISEKEIGKMMETFRGIVGDEAAICDLRSALFRANYVLDVAVASYFESIQIKKKKEHHRRKSPLLKGKKEEDTGDGLCKFCREPADHAYLPCGHLCVCGVCLKSDSGDVSESLCPVCKKSAKAHRIYTT